MNPEHVKKLWRLRFEKILELEQESFQFYKKLVEEKEELLTEAGIIDTLKEIIRDEARHINIARELVQLTSEGEEEMK